MSLVASNRRGEPDADGSPTRRGPAVLARRQMVRISRFADPRAFRDYFKTRYGPIIAAYRGIADDPQKVAALDNDLACLAERHLADSTAMDWEYLIITARKR